MTTEINSAIPFIFCPEDSGWYIAPVELRDVPEARIPVKVLEQEDLNNYNPLAAIIQFGHLFVITYPEWYMPAVWLRWEELHALANRDDPQHTNIVKNLIFQRMSIITTRFLVVRSAAEDSLIPDLLRRNLYLTISAIVHLLPSWTSAVQNYGAFIHLKNSAISPFTVNSENASRIYINFKSIVCDDGTQKKILASVEYFSGRPMVRLKPKRDQDRECWDREVAVSMWLIDAKSRGKDTTGIQVPETVYTYYKCYGEGTPLVFKERIYSPRRDCNLLELLNGRILSRPEKIKIAYHLCFAIHFFHKELNMGHGDIKPENVLIGADGSAYLCDFGVTRPLVPVIDSRFHGTESYSPIEEIEQLQHGFPLNGLVVNPETRDKWGLGLTLLMLDRGEAVPFWSALRMRRYPDFFRLYAKMEQEHIPRMNTLKAIARKLLLRQPEDRLLMEEAVEHTQKMYTRSLSTRGKRVKKK